MIVVSNPDRDVFQKVIDKCKKTQTPLISLSMQTDSLNPVTGNILQLGAVKYQLDEAGLLKEVGVFNKYVKSPIPVPAEITAINGITDDTIKSAESLDSVIRQLNDFTGKTCVYLLYNRSFIEGFMMWSEINHGISYNPSAIIDVYKMVRDVRGFADQNLKLSAIAELEKIKEEGRYNDSMHDAKIIGRVFNVYSSRFVDIFDTFPKGDEVPEIVSVKKEGFIITVECKYYGKIFLDTYTGTWTNEYMAFDKLSVNKLEQELLARYKAFSLRDLANKI